MIFKGEWGLGPDGIQSIEVCPGFKHESVRRGRDEKMKTIFRHPILVWGSVVVVLVAVVVGVVMLVIGSQQKAEPLASVDMQSLGSRDDSRLLSDSEDSQTAQSMKGGTLKTSLLEWPATLNSFTTTGAYISMVSSLVQGSLLGTSVDDDSILPFLAQLWEVSEDLKTVTFEIHPEATFDSGRPVTALDVKFTFDLIFDSQRCLKCAAIKGYIGPLSSVEVLSDRKIAISTDDLHFYFLRKIGSIPILEQAVYGVGDFNLDFNKVMHGAGPYQLDQGKTAHKKQIVLKRSKNFWLSDHPYYEKRYNFDEIIFKYIQDRIVAYESFKRGQTDFYYFDYNAFKFWDDKEAKIFTNPQVATLEYPFNNPYTFHLIAFNLRQDKLSDVRVRKALDHLMNRQMIVEKIFRGHNRAVSGPFAPGPYSAQLAPTSYDPQLAAEYLKQAGYTDVGDDGILLRSDEQGVKHRASFSLIHTKQAYEPWLTIYIEEAKKAGVELKVRLVEWSVLGQALQDFSWEVAAFGLVGGTIPLPRAPWHSEGAMVSGGSNYTGFSHPQADTLIEQLASAVDESVRYPLYHELETLIMDQRPMMFLWAQKNHYVAYWKNRLNPTSKPTSFYSGDQLRSLFFLHWISAE